VVHPDSGNLVLTGGQAGGFVVSYSTDSGVSWTRANLAEAGFCYALTVARSQPDVVYSAGVVSGAGVVYRSTDFGRTWTRAPGSLPDTVLGITVHPEDEGRVYAATPSGAFATTDGGSSWAILIPIRGMRAVRLYPGFPDTVLVAGDSGVFLSFDAGQSWQALNAGLLDTCVTWLEFAESGGVRLLAGTAHRACFAYTFSTGIEAPRDLHELDLRLMPNPASDRMVVLADPRRPHAALRLLDVAGRYVMRLQPGANDVSGLAPGVYFVRTGSGIRKVQIAR